MARARFIPISQRFTPDGDGVGDWDASGDYSLAEHILRFNARTDTSYTLVTSIHWTIEDTGNFDSGAWGNGITLTNGIKIEWHDSDDSVITVLTHERIKTSGELASEFHEITLHDFGQGNNYLTAEWDIRKDIEGGLVLTPGQYLSMHFEDNFTALVQQHFTVHGSYPQEGIIG